MLSGKDVTLVYETLLCAPGMLDAVKINLQLSRRNVLLLSKVMEQGLLTKPDPSHPSILQVLQETDMKALQELSEELLRKGGLTEMNERLNTFQSK